ncbi:hypothetical protein ACFSOZ_04875 [Mesorhizobium newzealandense]|uniref:Uncharacterized protein n=1 Tax=Mesorhizobium newzealandense TaxID=1300302 RepID=A0ABW4U6H4_9HYPH
MPHSTAVLLSHFGAWLLSLSRDKPNRPQEDGLAAPMPVQPARHNRLPPRDESFYWAWQYWSQ